MNNSLAYCCVYKAKEGNRQCEDGETGKFGVLGCQ